VKSAVQLHEEINTTSNFPQVFAQLLVLERHIAKKLAASKRCTDVRPSTTLGSGVRGSWV